MERIRETFNDGVFELRRQVTKRNAAREKVGVSTVTITKLHYRRMAMRDADVYSLGDGIAAKVTTKLKTVLHPKLRDAVKNHLFVTITGDDYNILYSDYDAKYCYLYLERMADNGPENPAQEAQ